MRSSLNVGNIGQTGLPKFLVLYSSSIPLVLQQLFTLKLIKGLSDYLTLFFKLLIIINMGRCGMEFQRLKYIALFWCIAFLFYL